MNEINVLIMYRKDRSNRYSYRFRLQAQQEVCETSSRSVTSTMHTVCFVAQLAKYESLVPISSFHETTYGARYLRDLEGQSLRYWTLITLSAV